MYFFLNERTEFIIKNARPPPPPQTTCHFSTKSLSNKLWQVWLALFISKALFGFIITQLCILPFFPRCWNLLFSSRA